MARSVSLSDEAFSILRREKQPQESDSDVVIRLSRQARMRARDPLSFFRNPPRSDLSPDEYDEVREKMREADRRKLTEDF